MRQFKKPFSLSFSLSLSLLSYVFVFEGVLVFDVVEKVLIHHIIAYCDSLRLGVREEREN